MLLFFCGLWFLTVNCSYCTLEIANCRDSGDELYGFSTALPYYTLFVVRLRAEACPFVFLRISPIF